MFKLLKRKRAVSPVIAVILLIALTVATVAIIWQVVIPLLKPSVSIVATTTDAASGVWTGKIDVSSDGTLNSVTITLSNGTDVTATISDANLESGQNALTLTFTGLAAGTYNLVFDFTPTGETSHTIYTLEDVVFT